MLVLNLFERSQVTSLEERISTIMDSIVAYFEYFHALEGTMKFDLNLEFGSVC